MERGSHVGPYLIEQPLGEGSVSAAFRAVHQSTGEIVALKLLRCRVTPKSLDDFFLQAKSVQDLEHPGVIKILDAGMAEDKLPYWVEELAPGDNLEVYMGRHRRGLPLDVQLTIAQQIAGILHATHEMSVPHLSLNPANVFLGPESSVPGGIRVQLTGFGSHFLQILGPGSSYAAAFQAPEQFGGSVKVSEKTDFYSLGCLLFFAATGTPPFPGGIEEIMAAHMKKAAPRISDFNPSSPHGLNLLVAKLLEKPPDERPKQARSIITAIEMVRKEMPAADKNKKPRSAFPETVQRISPSKVSEDAATHLRLPSVSGELETAVTTIDVGRADSVSVVVPDDLAAPEDLVAPVGLIGAPTVQVSDLDDLTDAAEDFSSDAFEPTDYASETYGTGYGEEPDDEEYDEDYGTGGADDFSYRTSDASQEYTAGSYSYSESSGQQFGLGSLGPGEGDGTTRAGKKVTLFGPGHVEGNQPITPESAAQRPFGTEVGENRSKITRSPAVTVSGVTGPGARASAVADGSNPGKSREKMDAAYALPLGDLAKKDLVPDHLRDAAPAPWMDKDDGNQEVIVGASAGASAPPSSEVGESGKVETNLHMEGGYPGSGPYGGQSPMGYPNQGGQPMPNYGPDQYRYPPPRQGGRFWPALIAVFFALLLGGALALFLVFGTNLFKGTQPGTLARDGSSVPAPGSSQPVAQQQQPVAPNIVGQNGGVPVGGAPVNGGQPVQNGLPPATVAGAAPQNGAFDARIENEPSLKDRIAQSGTTDVAANSGANLAAGTTDPNGAGVPRVIVFHTIDTVPEGATVFVAGRQAGVTPFRQELSAQNGVSAISIQKQGYLPVELELPTNRSAHRSISLRLVGGSAAAAAATSPFTDPANLPTADEAAAKAKAKAEAKAKAKKRRAKRRRAKRRNQSRVREGFIDEDDAGADDGGGFDDEPFEEGFIDE